MKKFIFRTSLFSCFVLISIFIVFSLADGSTDAMYLKFTTPQQKSMILGSSRAAQGIHPKELNSILKYDEIYNYAFQIPSSPYGEVYFESIKRKLSKKNKNGLFILEVNPWTLGYKKDENNNELFLEEDKFLNKTKNVTMNPNLEYLVESYNGHYFNILRDINRKGSYQTFFVENDGWLNVTIESNIYTKENRTKNKLNKYRGKLKDFNGLSKSRIESLKQLIKYLKDFGDVYLVRVPVIEGMHTIENEFQPDFDAEMNSIANEYQINYINYMKDNGIYDYTDGNHLSVQSGEKFSKDLANQIKKMQSQ